MTKHSAANEEAVGERLLEKEIRSFGSMESIARR